ncbi:MAG: hypothetical protein KJO09_04765 [Gammaproteobacteria bacterium]|nr:hypothetical protein [Gammaproteobacteria bacterium]
MNRVIFFAGLFCLWPMTAVAELNISIATFDPGVPGDYSIHQDLDVFPKIREIESLFLPFVLRQALVDAGDWGAVRVVPESDDSAELLITGAIVHSDGERLAVSLRAVDARGEQWLGASYFTEESYEDLFRRFVVDLAGIRDSLDDGTLSGIVDLSLMRYSAELVPDAFSDYFEQMPEGGYRLVRLPAEGDPMMARIHRVRSVEFVMTDAIDEKYRELHEEVDSVYEIWRKYRRWYASFRNEEAQRNELRESNATKGSYTQLRSVYDNYRMDRLAAQEQDKWIVGFNNETAPVIERMDQRIAEMNGWVEDGYLEWTRILSELFEIESGVD